MDKGLDAIREVLTVLLKVLRWRTNGREEFRASSSAEERGERTETPALSSGA